MAAPTGSERALNNCCDLPRRKQSASPIILSFPQRLLLLLLGLLSLLAPRAAALPLPPWRSLWRFTRQVPCAYAADKAAAVAERLGAIEAQHVAVANLTEAVASWQDALVDGAPQPLVLVLTGPTGVGKSETAYRVAEALLVSRVNVRMPEGQLVLEGEDYVDADNVTGLRARLKTELATVLHHCHGQAVVIFDEAQKAAHGVLGVLSPLLQGRRSRLSHPDLPQPLDARRLVLIIIADVGNAEVEAFLDEELSLQARAAAAGGARASSANLQHRLTARMRARLSAEFAAAGIDLGALADNVITFMPFNQTGVRSLINRLLLAEVAPNALAGGFATRLEWSSEVLTLLSIRAQYAQTPRCRADVVALLARHKGANTAAATTGVLADGSSAPVAAEDSGEDEEAGEELSICGVPCAMPRSCFVRHGARSIKDHGGGPIQKLKKILRDAKARFKRRGAEAGEAEAEAEEEEEEEEEGEEEGGEEGGGAGGQDGGGGSSVFGSLFGAAAPRARRSRAPREVVLKLSVACAPEMLDRTCSKNNIGVGVKLQVERCKAGQCMTLYSGNFLD